MFYPVISNFNYMYKNYTYNKTLSEKQNTPSIQNTSNALIMNQTQMSPVSRFHKMDLLYFGSSLEKIDKKETKDLILVTGHGNSKTAADMDTLAATLALAYLHNAENSSIENPEHIKNNYIPFIDPNKLDGEMKFALNYFDLNDFKEHSFTTEELNRKNIAGISIVDTNSISELPEKLQKKEVKEITDHHKLSGIKTSYAIPVNIKPYGATATLIYELFKEKNIKIPTDIAGLLLSGIISDTMLFNSETTTIKDKEAAKELAKAANINDIDNYGLNLLKEGDKTRTLSLHELVKTDLKPFHIGGNKKENVAINQIKTYSKGNLLRLLVQKSRLLQSMEQERPGKDLNIMMVTYFLPSQHKPSTYIFYNANTAHGKSLIDKAFPENTRKDKQENSFMMEGVSSRKLSVVKPLSSSK